MAEFEPVDHITWQFYEAEFDRILIFQPGVDFPAIREAAYARMAYGLDHFTDPAAVDVYLANLPPDTPDMAMNPRYLDGFLDLLEDYIEISFEHGTTTDPADIALNRQRAKDVVADLQLAAQVFDTVRDVNFDRIFPGEAAA